MRWPWKRYAVTDAEAQHSRRALAQARAREVDVDRVLSQRRIVKARNGFAEAIDTAMRGAR